MNTYVLNTGETVTAKTTDWPTQYANRTQAQRAAAKIQGAEVIQRGRPFYVRLPNEGHKFTPTAEFSITCAHCPFNAFAPIHDPK